MRWITPYGLEMGNLSAYAGTDGKFGTHDSDEHHYFSTTAPAFAAWAAGATITPMMWSRLRIIIIIVFKMYVELLPRTQLRTPKIPGIWLSMLQPTV